MQARLQRERQRVTRVLDFALEVAGALRQEFGDYWTTRELGVAPGPRQEKLMEAIGRIQAEAARAQRFVAEQERRPHAEALAALQAYELSGLLAATRGLQGLAASLRESEARPDGPTAARAPEPLAAAEQAAEQAFTARRALEDQRRALAATSDLAGYRAAPPRPAVRELSGAPRPAASARATGKLPGGAARPAHGDGWAGRTGDASAGLGGRRQLEAALRLAGDVLGYVSPRLAIVKASLGATGLPGPKKPWPEVTEALGPAAEEARIEPPLRPWLPHLAKLFYTDMAVTREALTALQQWSQARQLDAEGRRLAERMAALNEEAQSRLAAGFDLLRLRAAVYPLSHLHVRFRGVPHLSTIFPPPPKG